MADRQYSDAKPAQVVYAMRTDDKCQPGDGPVMDHALLDRFERALMSSDASAWRALLRHVILTGTAPDMLADVYVPALAMRLGDQWCSDELGFAKVTIGVARLQGMMRDLDIYWPDAALTDPQVPSALVVVMPQVYHTLGAIVMASQLRRAGVGVKLSLAQTPDEIAQLMQSALFSTIFISAPRSAPLEPVRKLIATLKATVDKAPPIIVGGSILEIETADGVTALTKADYATKDIDEALTFCGLQNRMNAVAPARGAI